MPVQTIFTYHTKHSFSSVSISSSWGFSMTSRAKWWSISVWVSFQCHRQVDFLESKGELNCKISFAIPFTSLRNIMRRNGINCLLLQTNTRGLARTWRCQGSKRVTMSGKLSLHSRTCQSLKWMLYCWVLLWVKLCRGGLHGGRYWSCIPIFYPSGGRSWYVFVTSS